MLLYEKFDVFKKSLAGNTVYFKKDVHSLESIQKKFNRDVFIRCHIPFTSMLIVSISLVLNLSNIVD